MDQKYSLYKSSKNFDRNAPVYIDLAKDYDEYGYISQELGEELDNLFEEDYIIGIHRTGYTIIQPDPQDINLQDIFNNGLYNNGDIMQGATKNKPSIEKTVSLYNNSILLNGAIKTADKYKNSSGCLIIKIPKSYLVEGGQEIMPIYYKPDQGPIRLMPEFIYGYIPVQNHTATSIIRNINYQNKHDTLMEQSLYEGNISFYCERNNISLPKVNVVSLKEKFDILVKAYIITLKKYGPNQANGALKILINNHKVDYFSGENNRIDLKKHLAYENVIKVLAYGLNANSINLEELLAQFQEYISNQITEVNKRQK